MTWKRKLAWAAAAALLAACALAAFGCNGGEAAGPEEAAVDETPLIEVTSAGATVRPVDVAVAEDPAIDAATVDFAFMIANNNEGMIAQNCTFDVTGYNADGYIIFTGNAVTEVIYPGITTVVTGTSQMDAEAAHEGAVATVKVEPIMANVAWTESELSESELQNLFAIENETANGDDDILSVSATVTGDLADANKLINTTSIESDVLGGHCVLVLIDAEGNVMMGSDASSVLIDQEFLDRVKTFEDEKGSGPSDETAPVNLLSSIANPPQFDRYELYVMPGLA